MILCTKIPLCSPLNYCAKIKTQKLPLHAVSWFITSYIFVYNPRFESQLNYILQIDTYLN